ncbi:MAG: hypothetical protein HUJ99_08650, partial [Bacteroidaceae bacterium]|nr:hypothetical protein [Bacteroidaceae bacterium]
PIDGRTKQTDGTYTGTTNAKTDFITQTDQAYVVSYKKTLKPEEDVDLHFKPIMTMIDLVITGSDDEDIYLSSVWVTLPDACDMLYGGQSATEMLDALDGYGYFDYKLVGNKNTDKLAQDEVPGVPVYNPTTNRQRRTFQFIFSRDFNGKYAPNNLEKADANNGDTFGYTRFVRVPKGGSITATLMLPPVEVRRDQLEIEVKSAGWGTNIYTMTSTASIPSGSKTQITLPKWRTNDWVDMGQHDANGNALLWKTKNIGANAVTEYGTYFERAWNQWNFGGVTLTEQGHTNYTTEFVPTPAMMRHLVPQPHSYTASTKFPYSVTNFNRTEIYEDPNWKPNNLPFYQYANYLLEAVAEDYCNQAWTNFNTKSTYTDSDNGKQSRGSDMSGYVFTSIKTGNCIFVPAGGYYETFNTTGNQMKGKGQNCNMWCNDNSDYNQNNKQSSLCADRRGYKDYQSNPQYMVTARKCSVQSQTGQNRTVRAVKWGKNNKPNPTYQ